MQRKVYTIWYMLIRVKVFPQSKKEALKEVGNLKFECFVRPKARNNEANERMLEMLRVYFPEARGISIVRGATTQNKTLRVFEPQENLL